MSADVALTKTNSLRRSVKAERHMFRGAVPLLWRRGKVWFDAIPVRRISCMNALASAGLEKRSPKPVSSNSDWDKPLIRAAAWLPAVIRPSCPITKKASEPNSGGIMAVASFMGNHLRNGLGNVSNVVIKSNILITFLHNPCKRR